RTLASDRHPIAIYEYTLARASQLRGDLEAKGPRLTRRDVVVGIRRGPIALVGDVLDIELLLPGRVDLREDAGVEAQEARQVHAAVGRRVRIREVDGAERGGPDRIDLILVPPRDLMERNELCGCPRGWWARCRSTPALSPLLPSASARGRRVPTRGSNEAGVESSACFAARNRKKNPAGAGLFTRGLTVQSQTWMRGLYPTPRYPSHT